MKVLENILQDLENVKVIDATIDYNQYIPLDISINNEIFKKTKHR
jgi:hypothetical protein